jgi:hypothetical protein
VRTAGAGAEFEIAALPLGLLPCVERTKRRSKKKAIRKTRTKGSEKKEEKRIGNNDHLLSLSLFLTLLPFFPLPPPLPPGLADVFLFFLPCSREIDGVRERREEKKEVAG